MAKKESPEAAPRGFGDIVGIVLAMASLLVLVALFSYDRNDLAFNHVPPNQPLHNWIGPVGAHLAYGMFFFLGAAAYFSPLVLVGIGLAYFFPALGYLRRCWPWAIVFLIACVGMLDLYRAEPFFSQWRVNLESGSAGGLLGLSLNNFAFGHYLGRVGATIIFAGLYLISLYYLTNFHVGEWLRALWPERAAAAGEAPA